MATLAVYLWALNQAVDSSGVRFAFSLAYFGFFITLFNLIPILPLDGGRVTSAISKWFNLAGLLILGGLVVSEVLGYSLGNPILILIFIIAVYSVWGRFRAARRGAEAPPLPRPHPGDDRGGVRRSGGDERGVHDPERGLAQRPRSGPQLRSRGRGAAPVGLSPRGTRAAPGGGGCRG